MNNLNWRKKAIVIWIRETKGEHWERQMEESRHMHKPDRTRYVTAQLHGYSHAMTTRPKQTRSNFQTP